jgi:RNA polymerase sigma factor (sigma-70 family)
MPRVSLQPLMAHLRKLAGPPAGPEWSDASLLGRFVRDQDEASFALLVERHGRLVWAVCRHLLGHEQDAEDAFQATLLVLARKAASIRKRRSLASWLYGVAYRTALKSRTTKARRNKYEQRVEARVAEGPVSEATLRELQAILDQEVERLPEKLRAPFVLCCLEGKSKSEAAAELGWPEGSVAGRTSQARKCLQQRLARRGLTLSAALCAATVAENTASAAMPALLAEGAVKAALAFAAGGALAGSTVPARAVALAESVLRAAAASRLKFVLVAVLVLGLFGGGAGAWVKFAPANNPEGETVAGLAPIPARDERAATGQDANAGQAVTLAGRVVAPDGQALPGAKVAVAASRRVLPQELDARFQKDTLGAGQSDQQGSFRLTMPGDARERNGITLIASSPGYGLAWKLVRDLSQGEVPLELEPAQSARVRLLDQQGEPAAGVVVHLSGIGKKRYGGDILQFQDPPDGLPPWPAPVMTDAEGNCTLPDLGPNWDVYLQVRDDRFALQVFLLKTGAGERAEPHVFTVAPACFLEGQVTYADTGQPVAGASLSVSSSGDDRMMASLATIAGGRTDPAGRFRINPYPGRSLSILVEPPADAPYLGLMHSLSWPPKEKSEKVQLVLPRGVQVRGAVLEEGTEKPVVGATVEFMARIHNNPHAFRANRREHIRDKQQALTAADGSFQMILLPGPAHLLVKAATADYLHVMTSDMQLMQGRPGGNAYYPDGLLPLDLQPADRVINLAPIILRRGVTVHGKVIGADGKPADSGLVFCPGCLTRTYIMPGTPFPFRDGRFELPGCEPTEERTVWFFDAARHQGCVAQVSCREDSERVVRLAPCGSVTARLVPAAGAKVSGSVQTELAMAWRSTDIAPNPPVATNPRLVPAYTIRDSAAASVDGKKVTFRQLIPGAAYVLRVNLGRGWVNLKEFTVKPGEELDLKDVTFQPLAPPGTGPKP